MEAGRKLIQEISEQALVRRILDSKPDRLVSRKRLVLCLRGLERNRGLFQVDRLVWQRSVHERQLLSIRVRQHVITNLPKHEIDVETRQFQIPQQRGRVGTVAA